LGKATVNMFIAWFKYTFSLTLAVSVWISFASDSLWSWLPVIYGFVAIPLAEAVFGSNTSNNNDEEERKLLQSRGFDLMLYLVSAIHLATVLYFIAVLCWESSWSWILVGQITGMGIMCGVYGINVAHELGHRSDLFSRMLAQLMLSTSLYMHFYIEHNEGHHRNVSTPEDPASARKGESVYAFFCRSIIGSWYSALTIERKRLRRKKVLQFSRYNRMLRYSLFQAVLLTTILFVAGVDAFFAFLISAAIGILLLETINYIEHYGLQRNKVSDFRYEDANPSHSWNSDHCIGRLLLFELARHSDHHYDPSRKYQILRSFAHSPRLPMGYPSMVLLAFIPPLWFVVMNPLVDNVQKSK